MGEEPEEERKAKAEEEAGDDGEIESGVLAAVDDVAGKAAEAKRELAAEIKKSADEDEEAAEEKKGAAEFAERVHGEHCSGGGGRKGRRGSEGGKGSKGNKRETTAPSRDVLMFSGS